MLLTIIKLHHFTAYFLSEFNNIGENLSEFNNIGGNRIQYDTNGLYLWSYFKLSKLEKVPKDVQSEKYGKLQLVWENWSQQLDHMQVQKRTEPGVRKGKLSRLACRTRRKCSMETSRDSLKVKVCIKVPFVYSLICWEVTASGQPSECHLTFCK